MTPRSIEMAAQAIDLSGRWFHSVAVAASPAAATETTVATLTITEDISALKAVYLSGWAAYTVGTSGVSANLKLRRTDTSGTTLAASGALTVAAGNLRADDVNGVDSVAVAVGQVYVLTLTIGSGAAVSTVSAVFLGAVVV